MVEVVSGHTACKTPNPTHERVSNGHAVHTELAPASTYFLAEDHHRNHDRKNELRHSDDRLSRGRDERVKALWT